MKIISNLSVPESWEEVSFGTYQLLTSLEMNSLKTNTGELENSIKILATLLKTNVKTIEELKAVDFMEIQSVVKFLSTEIKHTNNVKWRFTKLKDLTMDKWIAYEKYKENSEQNILKILELLQKDYKEKEIREFGVGEVLRGFFILQKRSESYMRRFHLFLNLKMIKWVMKFKWMRMVEKLKKVKLVRWVRK